MRLLPFVKAVLFIFLSLLTFHFSLLTQVYAEEPDRLTEIQKQINELQTQLDSAKSQEKTLKTQVDFIDNQVKLSQLKIDQANAQLARLEIEINQLSTKITTLSANVDQVSEVLLNRIVQNYKYGNIGLLDLMLSSKGFSDLLQSFKYIQVAQAHDKDILYRLQGARAFYNESKSERENRQAQQAKIKKDMEAYQKQLADQKKGKEELLRITQNDEKRYQQLIAQLRAEQDSIAKALGNITATIGPKSKGDVIASMGSTGCSTGPHLHFEAFENAKVEGTRIVGTRINPHNYLDNGKLGSPLRGYPGETTITTEYNEPYEVFGYRSFHTGLDIAPRSYEGAGRAILAADNGIAYVTSAPCDCYVKNTCSSTMMKTGSATGKGIIIDHQNGLVTLYWHIL